jgi:hypothetical protein
MIHVTQHAIERWRERVDPRADEASIRDAISASAPAIETAARFGCRTVRTCMATLVLQERTVVTVLPRRWQNRSQA